MFPSQEIYGCPILCYSREIYGCPILSSYSLRPILSAPSRNLWVSYSLRPILSGLVSAAVERITSVRCKVIANGATKEGPKEGHPFFPVGKFKNKRRTPIFPSREIYGCPILFLRREIYGCPILSAPVGKFMGVIFSDGCPILSLFSVSYSLLSSLCRHLFRLTAV